MAILIKSPGDVANLHAVRGRGPPSKDAGRSVVVQGLDENDMWQPRFTILHATCGEARTFWISTLPGIPSQNISLEIFDWSIAFLSIDA